MISYSKKLDTYTVSLPDNLPPTFRGRTVKFSYELVVGTCRAGPTPVTGSGSVGANSVSRVMKVPIRVYNNVLGMVSSSDLHFGLLMRWVQWAGRLVRMICCGQ